MNTKYTSHPLGMKISTIVFSVQLVVFSCLAVSSEKEALETYLDKVAKLDSVIDSAFNGRLSTEESTIVLKASKEELKVLHVPEDAHYFHTLIIDKYDPIITMIYMADKGIKEKEASKGEKRREIMEYSRKEMKKITEALTPTLHKAEVEFDRLISIHNISAQDRDINFHGLAVKKVNIHVNVLDFEGQPIQGALVNGFFFQDQVVNKINKPSHNGITDSRGYCLLSGREEVSVDVRVTTLGYKNVKKMVLVRDGKDKVLKIILSKDE
ncbi:MAG: carboxypeptidase-like regulatory domain-containing protein [Candidatus Thiodiazotropha sp. L084R]